MTRQPRSIPLLPERAAALAAVLGTVHACALLLALFAASGAQAQSLSASAPDSPAPDTATAATAEETPPTLQILTAADVTLDEFLWTNRVVVVFADTPADPRFNEQIELLTNRPQALIERDVVVIIDTDPDARTSVRLKLRPRGFQMALIGKDGEVELRKPSPWSSREISRSIDKMPLRQQEIREQKNRAG